MQGGAYRLPFVEFRVDVKDGGAFLTVEENSEFNGGRRADNLFRCAIGAELAEILIRALVPVLGNSRASWDQLWVETPNTRHTPGR